MWPIALPTVCRYQHCYVLWTFHPEVDRHLDGQPWRLRLTGHCFEHPARLCEFNRYRCCYFRNRQHGQAVCDASIAAVHRLVADFGRRQYGNERFRGLGVDRTYPLIRELDCLLALLLHRHVEHRLVREHRDLPIVVGRYRYKLSDGDELDGKLHRQLSIPHSAGH